MHLDTNLLHAGAAQPLLGGHIDYTDFHGLDGLGDVPEAQPQQVEAVSPAVTSRHAALALVEAARLCAQEEEAGDGEKLTVVAVGPLTNIALALRYRRVMAQRYQMPTAD